MAKNLQILKRRIKTAQNISQIAKAMEMIAASKIKRAQRTVNNHRPYAQAITNQTENIVRHTDPKKFTHPYFTTNKSDKKLLVVISPDKGLAGSLITNMVRKFLEQDLSNTYVLSIGKKLERHAVRQAMEVIASFPMGTSLPSYSVIYPIIKIINEYYIQKKVSTVEVLYPDFTSIFSQTPTIKKILPLDFSETNGDTQPLPYTFEPNIETILEDLLPYYLEVVFYNMLIETHTSEQAARMMAMQNAKNNAKDIADYLKLSYNKSRQEKITNELLDLTNGQVAV